jgi:hypothetical protein
MSSESSSSSNELLEQVFNLIQSGNEHESSSQPWQAVSSYAQAAGLLDQLAHDAIRPKSSTGDNKEEEAGADDASRKIAALYASQSLEYTVRSRSILLQALQDEHERDKQTSGEVSGSHDEASSAASRQDCFVRSSLSDEELNRRIQLFASLFARPQQAIARNAPAESTAAPDADADADADAAATEQSLQDRWMNLNQNLPKGFKTSDQRLADINRGLNRLGLSSVQYHSSDSGPTSRVNPYDVLGGISTTNMSETEQVEDIIAQATDEVRLLQQQMGPLTADVPGASNIAALRSDGGPATASASGSIGSDAESSDPDDDDDDDDEDAVDDALSTEEIASVGVHAATAQAELAQLFALLEKDEGGDAAIEFDPAAGLHHLRRAMSSLRKAKRAWTSSSSSPGSAAAAAEDKA